MQLYKNYQQAQSRHLRPSCVGSPPLVSVHRGVSWGGYPDPVPGTLGPCSDRSSPALSHAQRSVSDNTLVAMDFSGHTGRIIENPQEALSVALEEAHAWRVRRLHSPACWSWGTSLHLGFQGGGEGGMRGGPQVQKGALPSSGQAIPQPGPATPTLVSPLFCRRRRTTVSACPPRAPAPASVQVGAGAASLGLGASLCTHGGGRWLVGGSPQSDCPPVCLSPQPSTEPNPGSMDGFPVRRASGSSPSKAW